MWNVSATVGATGAGMAPATAAAILADVGAEGTLVWIVTFGRHNDRREGYSIVFNGDTWSRLTNRETKTGEKVKGNHD